MMMNDLMEDAKDIGLDIGHKYSTILTLVDKFKNELNLVTKPVLVHKDLYLANVFINDDKISGIIDWERSIWAEPLIEAVCTFSLHEKSFMDEFYGEKEFTRDEKIRIDLYKLYLFSLMTIETPYRQYKEEGLDKWPREQLDLAVKNLTTNY